MVYASRMVVDHGVPMKDVASTQSHLDGALATVVVSAAQLLDVAMRLENKEFAGVMVENSYANMKVVQKDQSWVDCAGHTTNHM